MPAPGQATAEEIPNLSNSCCTLAGDLSPPNHVPRVVKGALQREVSKEEAWHASSREGQGRAWRSQGQTKFSAHHLATEPIITRARLTSYYVLRHQGLQNPLKHELLQGTGHVLLCSPGTVSCRHTVNLIDSNESSGDLRGNRAMASSRHLNWNRLQVTARQTHTPAWPMWMQVCSPVSYAVQCGEQQPGGM